MSVAVVKVVYDLKIFLCKMLVRQQLLLNKRICHYEWLLRSGQLPLHAAQVSDEARFHLTEYSSSQYLPVGCGKWPMLCIKLLYVLKVLECDVCCLIIFFVDSMNSEKRSDIGRECLGQCISNPTPLVLLSETKHLHIPPGAENASNIKFILF